MHAHSGLDLSWMNADGWTPIVGYRRFRVPYNVFLEVGFPHKATTAEDFKLRGVNPSREPSISEAWDYGDSEAKCWIHAHAAPDHNCKCGLHGWMNIDDAIEYKTVTSIVASVIGWGKMYFDDLYWRAEYARPIALAEPLPETLKEGGNIRLLHNNKNWIEAAERLTVRAAREYGIPVLALEDLEDYTLQYGDDFGGHPNGKTEAGASDGAANSASDHAG
jgi:hypothetical protein